MTEPSKVLHIRNVGPEVSEVNVPHKLSIESEVFKLVMRCKLDAYLG